MYSKTLSLSRTKGKREVNIHTMKMHNRCEGPCGWGLVLLYKRRPGVKNIFGQNPRATKKNETGSSVVSLLPMSWHRDSAGLTWPERKALQMSGANIIKNAFALSSVSISHAIVNPSSVLAGWTGKRGCGDGNVLFSDSPPCRLLTPGKVLSCCCTALHALRAWG